MILDSLAVCPGCLHHLRVDNEASRRQAAGKEVLRVEGVVAHPGEEGTSEYHVVLSVRNERGDEISRQVMSVGALHNGEKRSFAVSVEVLPAQAPPKQVPAPPPPPPSPPPQEPKPRVGGYDLKPPGLKPKKG
jgi:hypothetical protein